MSSQFDGMRHRVGQLETATQSIANITGMRADLESTNKVVSQVANSSQTSIAQLATQIDEISTYVIELRAVTHDNITKIWTGLDSCNQPNSQPSSQLQSEKHCTTFYSD